MNYIPTPPAAIKYFKSAAKRRVKAGDGSHVEMLDEVARAFGYLHWHHVDLCAKHYLEFQGPVQPADSSAFIALPIGEGARGYEMLQRAIEDGVRVSADRRHLLFDHPQDDDDVHGHLGAAEDCSGRVDTF